ncbi:hypothetical protein C8C95_2639 [Acidovorax sp. 99]|uniref:hypothetical protein n=1 Tax=Acidovorax sp. 99 TaxID=2135634 RepID=UPI000D5D4D88|nr:hypothetical protein [Acidovorax sp. 99]PVY91781.1 hypothetical protein C8C95_2639 [Acidovorax sp. 99]
MDLHVLRRLRRIRTEFKDAIELVALPALAAVLPWSVAYRVARRILVWLPAYRGAAIQALAEYKALFPVSDERAWLMHRRLVTWTDHADHYLARTRQDHWMNMHLDVQGEWPPSGQAAMLFTFHWGAGMWGLRHAARGGLLPRALVASTEGAPFLGRTVLSWYARARTATVHKALGCEPLDVSGSLRPAIKALRAGGQVLAAIDVPTDQSSSAEHIRLLGLVASVPRALHRLAVDQRVPVYVYITGFDVQTGRRQLNIVSLGVYDDVSRLITTVFAELERVLQREPEAWHFWSEARRFFKD